jgi:hypothetical protein
MAISQPSYPITTTDLVSHIGAYADTKGGGSLPYINVAASPYNGDIVAAYTALPSTGGLLYCPGRGPYSLSGGKTLQGTKPVTIEGDGSHTTLFQAASTAGGGFSFRGPLTPYSAVAGDWKALTANVSHRPGSVPLPDQRPYIDMASTTGIVVGDYLYLASDQAWPDTLQSTTHGEWVKVRNVTSSTRLELFGYVLHDYTTVNNARVLKPSMMSGMRLAGVAIENTTPKQAENGLCFLDGVMNPQFEDVRFGYSDKSGIELLYTIGGVATQCKFHDFDDWSASSPIRLGYGIRAFNGCERFKISDCEGDRLRNFFTTNGIAGPGVARFVMLQKCTMVNATNNAFSSHEEGEYIFNHDCVSIQGAEAQSEGGGMGAGIQPRCPRYFIRNFTTIGPHRAGVWTRWSAAGGATDCHIDGLYIEDARNDQIVSGRGIILEADRAYIRNARINGAEGRGIQIDGNFCEVEVDIKDAGTFQGDVAIYFTGDNNKVRARVTGSSPWVWSGTIGSNKIDVIEMDSTVGIGDGRPLVGKDPVQFVKAGAQTVATAVGGRIYNHGPGPKFIRGVVATVGTAPTGAALIVDVNKNGTTVFTTQTNRPTIAIGAFTSGLAANMEVIVLAVGDYLTVDVDQIGSTVAGSDLRVAVDFVT